MKKVPMFLMMSALHSTLHPQELPSALLLQSNNFGAGASIPSTHARLHGNISPHLAWKHIPQNTKSFALICSDPDAPSKNFIHWVLYNIPASVHELAQGISLSGLRKSNIKIGKNDFGNFQYDGPQPSSGMHHYIFTLYAVDSILDLPDKASYQDVITALQGHVISSGTLTGTYSAS